MDKETRPYNDKVHVRSVLSGRVSKAGFDCSSLLYDTYHICPESNFFSLQTWFKNRRVKWRKEQRKRQSVVVSTPPTLSTGLYFHYFGHVPYPSSKLMLKDARMLYGSAASSAD